MLGHLDGKMIEGSVDPGHDTTKANGECQQSRVVQDFGN